MQAIFKREFWDRRKSLLAYCIIGIALLWMYVALFPSIKASSRELEKLFQSYPKAVYAAFGIDNLSFNTLEKFLSVELFSFMWPILAIIFTMSRAGSTLSGEIEKGTMGLYLSLPISRMKLFLSKYTAAVISMIIFVLITILGILPLGALYNESPNTIIVFKLAVVSLLFMLVIYSISMLFSAIFSERSKVYMVVGGSLLIMYAVNVVASLKPALSWLHKCSIFYYYNAQEVLTKGSLHTSYVLVYAGIIIFSTIVAVLVFSKRDIIN